MIMLLDNVSHNDVAWGNNRVVEHGMMVEDEEIETIKSVDKVAEISV